LGEKIEKSFRMLYKFILFCLLLSDFKITAQSVDSSTVHVDTLNKSIQVYSFEDANLIYAKPRKFQFITQIPKTFAKASKETFRKKTIPALLTIAASTVLLTTMDQKISNRVSQFYNYSHISTDRDYKRIIGFKIGKLDVSAYEAPQNLNTILYSIGEGSTSLLLAGGISLFGHLKKDYRARQASSQIVQSMIAVGITCQLMKRIAGRESPFTATQAGGAWRPLPGFAEYQSNVRSFDAFPSGHMATMMATVTVLGDNYPEKKWIKPVGYSVMSLVGVSMIGNGVHWISDYPLAIGIGYVLGKVTVKMNRAIQKKSMKR
jgi:membrane-associated phospholipid phosphatase